MELFKHIKDNTTIVTPNRRLAATLAKKSYAYQCAQGKNCWQTIDALPFQPWVTRLWDELNFITMQHDVMLLNPTQEFLLWEAIIKKSPSNDTLLQVSPTAELAMSAWGTLKQWQVPLDHPMLGITEDSAAFLQWSNTYKKICAAKSWCDFNSVIDMIIKAIETKTIIPPPEVIVLGFTEYSPIQKQLFQSCENAGSRIIYLENLEENTHTKTFYVGLNDTETEILTMARWSKAMLETSRHKTTIGCIIPNLENIRDQVQKIFSEVFSGFHGHDQSEAFNISAGKSLSQFPVIHAALKILAFSFDTISQETLNYWLTSPFIGEAEQEQVKRAMFDARLRQANISSISFQKLSDPNERLTLKKHCPLLAKRLEALCAVKENQPSEQSLSDWAAYFMEALNSVGWPGERSLNSHEYQVVQRFCDTLVEFQALDTIMPSTHQQNALHYLQHSVTKTVFQPQTKDAPIQILGLLEAASIPFDFSWIMGLDDSVWPPAAKPNPLLPHSLQKTLQMPHATAEKELHYSTKLTKQLIQSTQHIIFSYPQKNGDCEGRPSALISSFKPQLEHEIPQSDFISTANFLYQHHFCEAIEDNLAPTVSPEEKLQGGVSIFKKQALCPFKAFAEIRLHATALSHATPGLRPEERGTITHKALELIGKHISDSTMLQNIHDVTLQQIVRDCVEKAIEDKTNQNPHETRYLTLEAERLEKLLWHWLQKEKTREPFRIIAQEQEREITIEGLTIHCRVDRIDALENGDHLVIDYKTGKNITIKDWFDDRPEEPQLPLYCLTDTSSIKAIAFAGIHPDNLSLTGITHQGLAANNLKTLDKVRYAANPDWNQQVETWKNVFSQLSTDFLAGRAFVDPKNANETCQYCELHPLCRIHDVEEQTHETD